MFFLLSSRLEGYMLFYYSAVCCHAEAVVSWPQTRRTFALSRRFQFYETDDQWLCFRLELRRIYVQSDAVSAGYRSQCVGKHIDGNRF